MRHENSNNPEEIARLLARLLAPYVADELERRGGPGPASSTEASPDYDERTCDLFVAGLGAGVAPRARRFFEVLARDGSIGSLALAHLLGLDTPRRIPANLTNSLKKRAMKLGLPEPWDLQVSEDDRTVWVDRDGIAQRIVDAIDRRRTWFELSSEDRAKKLPELDSLWKEVQRRNDKWVKWSPFRGGGKGKGWPDVG